MLRTLDLYRRLITVQLLSQFHFRFAFAMETVSTALISVVEFGSLVLVMQRLPEIDGWTLGEVAFLYGMVSVAFELMDLIFSGFDPRRFGEAIRRGLLDQMLLRPMSITLQVFASELALRRLGKVALGIAIVILGVHWSGMSWTLGKILYLPVVIISMVLFFGGLFIIGATITFWTVESIEVMNILTYGGRELISYPMTVYQRWMRQLFTYLIPAIFLNYYPALYFLDKTDPLGLPYVVRFTSPLAGGAMFFIAMLFWGYGLRRYQSTGT